MESRTTTETARVPDTSGPPALNAGELAHNLRNAINALALQLHLLERSFQPAPPAVTERRERSLRNIREEIRRIDLLSRSIQSLPSAPDDAQAR